MKVIAYPVDEYGCGHHRVIWPATVLQQDGIDISIIRQFDRKVRMFFDGDGKINNVDIPEDIDVVVFQRPTDQRVAQAVRYLREVRGVAVVIDVDDDLSAIHPSNPAFTYLDPNRAKHEVQAALRSGELKLESADRAYGFLKNKYTHSWHNLSEACKHASVVTVSTPGLLKRYAAHGRGVVVSNFAPDHYLNVEHEDSNKIGWGAALHSHPNDPPAVGNALARVVSEGATFATIGDSKGVGTAFGLREEPPGGDVTLEEWPTALTKIGIGIAPLADTLFNSRKSWLKPLEMSAVGVPWIASPRAEYAKLHKNYGAGLLAEKPRDWYRALRSLLDDPEHRMDLSAVGREAADNLRLSANAWRYAEAWEQALTYERSASATRAGALP